MPLDQTKKQDIIRFLEDDYDFEKLIDDIYEKIFLFTDKVIDKFGPVKGQSEEGDIENLVFQHVKNRTGL